MNRYREADWRTYETRQKDQRWEYRSGVGNHTEFLKNWSIRSIMSTLLLNEAYGHTESASTFLKKEPKDSSD